MTSEWEKSNLGKVSTEVSYGYTESANLEKIGPHFLRITDIQNGVVDWNTVPYCKIDHKKLDQYKLAKGDIVVARTGNSTGENYIFTGESETVYASYLIKFKIDRRLAYPHYIWYLMRSPSWWSFIESSKTGSAQAGANAKTLSLFPVLLPPLSQQKAAADFLIHLDDKIELNRQTNKTLEAMAQALFKSWFVDFDPVIDNALAAGNPIPEVFAERAKLRASAKNIDSQSDSESSINGASNYQHLFPAEFEFTEEIGWIPLGWNTCEVGDQLVRLKVKKRYTKNYAISYGKIPIYEQGVNILLGYHNEDPDLNATMESPIFIFGDHTCVTKLSIEPFSISANVIPLQGKDYPTTWVYYAVKDKQKFEEYRRHWMELIIKPLLLPSKELSNIFVTFAQEVKSREKHVERQNSELTKLRDTLLPKLLSGELRIPDAEKLMAEADV